ncbi:MAG: signal recognition particle-docking protein FtsY [Desulforhopalus sp.]
MIRAGTLLLQRTNNPKRSPPPIVEPPPPLEEAGPEETGQVAEENRDGTAPHPHQATATAVESEGDEKSVLSEDGPTADSDADAVTEAVEDLPQDIDRQPVADKEAVLPSPDPATEVEEAPEDIAQSHGAHSESEAEPSAVEERLPVQPPEKEFTPPTVEAPVEDEALHGEEPSFPKQAEQKPPVAEKKVAESKKKSLFSRLTDRLGKTRETLTYQIDALFLGKKEISADLLDDLEEILITADLGVSTSQELIEYARRKVKRKELADVNSLKKALKKKIRRFIAENDQDATLVMPDRGPFVIMVIGVNGVGKTTTIGKIANKFVRSGSSVLLAAGDTFRAAAVAQLKIWGERNNVEVVAHKEGADPSSVAYDALEKAVAKDIDVVLIDTAGRMHTKDNLMEELKKIKRVMGKKLPGAPHEVMLVIDATTGQNGISQAKLFDAAVDVTGITLTKLDGTSKGGIVVNISREMKIPIRFIGIGEQVDDLRDFDPGEFADALFQDRDAKQQ